MDDWFKQLQEDVQAAVNHTLAQTEQLFDVLASQAIDAISPVLDAADEMADELAEQVVENISPPLAQALDNLESQLDPWVGSVVTWCEQTMAPVHQTLTPWLQNHPKCAGCSYYHGESYGGEMLVCALHPTGPEVDQECPDWDSVWPQPKE
ncbi:hypothetical protein [Leptothoe sp. PORK10 BA2]|uniref:hypothetical protein n=1 Tax=Leptothoe sp. PORK10 BA2 TaxID=3110254 RepID=UPI002B1F85BD|nr:hypothetical protein [Leptothoe sp. PORK10 BA2]MEA5464560.1 hypothetical protein [Leptothoe sp. PORK10 BA2]